MVQRNGDGKKKKTTTRTPTAYSYLGADAVDRVKPTRAKVNYIPQGPHFMPHVGTKLFFEKAKESGRPLTDLLNTRIIPRPRQALAQVKSAFKFERDQHQLSNPSQDDRMSSTHYPRRRFVQDYKTLYDKAQARGDEDAIHRLVELAPHQSLAWAGKRATSAEKKYKGETIQDAADDFVAGDKLAADSEGNPSFTANNYLTHFKTVDADTLTGRKIHGPQKYMKRHYDFGSFLRKEKLSPASDLSDQWSSSDEEPRPDDGESDDAPDTIKTSKVASKGFDQSLMPTQAPLGIKGKQLSKASMDLKPHLADDDYDADEETDAPPTVRTRRRKTSIAEAITEDDEYDADTEEVEHNKKLRVQTDTPVILTNDDDEQPRSPSGRLLLE